MLYVYYGSHTERVADHANKLVAGLLKRRADAQVFRFEGGGFEVQDIDELIEARGLFIEKHVVVLKQPLETRESRDHILERLEQFQLSENIFVIAEGVLGAKEKKALEKHAEKIEELAAEKRTATEFNVFALGDALGARKRKELWLLYLQARHAGVEAASLLGTMHWAVRGMLLARRTANANEAGQKPFMYSKFKRYAANYSEQELLTLSRKLIAIYHDTRRGKVNIENGLERLTLTV